MPNYETRWGAFDYIRAGVIVAAVSAIGLGTCESAQQSARKRAGSIEAEVERLNQPLPSSSPEQETWPKVNIDGQEYPYIGNPIHTVHNGVRVIQYSIPRENIGSLENRIGAWNSSVVQVVPHYTGMFFYVTVKEDQRGEMFGVGVN